MTLRAAAAAALSAWDRAESVESITAAMHALRRALADDGDEARERELERLREIARKAGREVGPQ